MLLWLVWHGRLLLLIAIADCVLQNLLQLLASCFECWRSALALQFLTIQLMALSSSKPFSSTFCIDLPSNSWILFFLRADALVSVAVHQPQLVNGRGMYCTIYFSSPLLYVRVMYILLDYLSLFPLSHLSGFRIAGCVRLQFSASLPLDAVSRRWYAGPSCRICDWNARPCVPDCHRDRSR